MLCDRESVRFLSSTWTDKRAVGLIWCVNSAASQTPMACRFRTASFDTPHATRRPILQNLWIELWLSHSTRSATNYSSNRSLVLSPIHLILSARLGCALPTVDRPARP